MFCSYISKNGIPDQNRMQTLIVKRLYTDYTPTKYQSAHFPFPVMNSTNIYELRQFALKTDILSFF